jgi:hypothetical protein
MAKMPGAVSCLEAQAGSRVLEYAKVSSSCAWLAGRCIDMEAGHGGADSANQPPAAGVHFSELGTWFREFSLTCTIFSRLSGFCSFALQREYFYLGLHLL